MLASNSFLPVWHLDGQVQEMHGVTGRKRDTLVPIIAPGGRALAAGAARARITNFVFARWAVRTGARAQFRVRALQAPRT